MHYGTLGPSASEKRRQQPRGVFNTRQVFNTAAAVTHPAGSLIIAILPGGSSSWVSITANANGLMVINTYGSSFQLSGSLHGRWERLLQLVRGGL